IREAVKGIPGAEVSVDQESSGPPQGKPVAIEVSGDDYPKLAALSKKVERYVDSLKIGGIEDLRSDLQDRNPEIGVRINRVRANREDGRRPGRPERNQRLPRRSCRGCYRPHLPGARDPVQLGCQAAYYPHRGYLLYHRRNARPGHHGHEHFHRNDRGRYHRAGRYRGEKWYSTGRIHRHAAGPGHGLARRPRAGRPHPPQP
nr:hypothetical protein [Tanacetum cinerariifolium]